MPEMSSTLKNFILVMVPIGMGVAAQILLKFGMLQFGKFSIDLAELPKTFFNIFLNPYVLTGMTLYFLASLIWLVVLSRIELSFAYPLLSLGYIFILIFSALVFKENVTIVRTLGVVAICFGVILISRS